MREFEYCSPTEIIFGENAEEKTGLLVKKYGGSKVLIVYGGQSVLRNGLLAKMEDELKKEGLDSISMGGVVPNPLLSKVREMVKEGLAFGADFILGVGGGSVLDTAKAVAHGIASPETDVWDFWCGKAVVKKSLPIGAVLTISAAGSETSNSSVITNDELEEPSKRGMTVELNRPKFAVMNPKITMTLPKWQIGAGAADIFMHTSERFFTSIQGNYLSDEMALGLMRTAIKFGPIAVRNPENYEAMSELMWSGSVSHIGLTGLGSLGNTKREGDWSCHQLGMAISAIYDSTHGATLTAVWGSWARYVMDQDIARFADYGRRVFELVEADDRKTAFLGIEKTEAFFKELGMPITLTELLGHKPTEEEIRKIVKECSQNGTRKIGTLKELDAVDIEKIYRMAL